MHLLRKSIFYVKEKYVAICLHLQYYEIKSDYGEIVCAEKI